MVGRGGGRKRGCYRRSRGNLKREQERERGYRKGEGGRKSLIADGGRSKSGRRRSDSREVYRKLDLDVRTLFGQLWEK